MKNSQSLSINQGLRTRLTQQQLRFVRLLELNTPELNEKIDQELESNPALEAIGGSSASVTDTPALPERNSFGSWQQSSTPDIPLENTAPEDAPSLYDYLNDQLAEQELDQEVFKAAQYIIGNLDTNGYLQTPLNQIVLDISVNENEEISLTTAEEALAAVRRLEPAGVGARTLQECLTLQLQRLPNSQQKVDALAIMNSQFQDFSLKHPDKIASSLKIDKKRVAVATDLILQLNPKPGAQFESRNSEAANFISPDFILDNQNGVLTISLPNSTPELAINQSFSLAVSKIKKKEASGELRKSAKFIVANFNDATEFIRLLSQRQQTLMTVASAILSLQREYFETGDLYLLRPMMIKDITRLTGFDASVISRATAGKHIQTPWGIYPMRFFFSDTIGENGEDNDALTNRKLEAEIKTIIEGEDKKTPLNDDKLQQELGRKGYEVSRRTVAKYRNRLGIPVARLRKSIKS